MLSSHDDRSRTLSLAIRCPFNLHEVIRQLEHPAVRVEDTASYAIDVATLGQFYAYYTSLVPVDSSPGLMLQRNGSLPGRVIQELQKRFQLFSRRFLYARVGELQWRRGTAQQLAERYFPGELPKFAAQSIESKVAELAEQGKFSLIGEQLKAGAAEYDHKARQKNMPHYRFASEYTEILNALRGS